MNIKELHYMKRIYTLITVSMMTFLGANAEATDMSSVNDALYFDRVEVKAGDNATLQIKMKNATNSVGTFATKVTMPEGFSFGTDGNDPDVSLLTERTGSSTFAVASAFQSDANAIKIGLLQTEGANLGGNDGAVIAMNVKVGADVQVGSYEVLFSEQEFVEALSSANYYPADATSVIVVTSADGIDGVRADGTKAASPVKRIVDGKLVIETLNGTYNAMGAQTK